MNFNTVIIGGGASGLMTATLLSKKDKNIALVEGNSKLGKKLLATGNGKCNLGNRNLNLSSFHGDTKYIQDILEKYPMDKMEKIFHKIGIDTIADEEGRVYPKSLQAQAVTNALIDSIKENGASIFLDFKVCDIKKNKGQFFLKDTNGNIISCKNLVISTGGKASPKHGCGDVAYDLIGKLGHKISKTSPAIVNFLIDDKNLKALSGVRSKCIASLVCDNKNIHSEKGEMIFSEKGVSGICVFILSSKAQKYIGKKLNLNFDLLPDTSEIEIEKFIKNLIINRPKMKASEILSGMVNIKLSGVIIKKCGIDFNSTIKNISSEQVKKLAKTIKNMNFIVKSLGNWDNAQVTSGGVFLSEIDMNTMQSKIQKNLYFTGEILNIDGDCGGFNLYWAWTTALITAEKIMEN